MNRLVGSAIVFIGASGFALAGITAATPEIGASSAFGALALLSGGILVLRGRRKEGK